MEDLAVVDGSKAADGGFEDYEDVGFAVGGVHFADVVGGADVVVNAPVVVAAVFEVDAEEGL